jgi:HAD superfamily hydrolase (TIGR01509 family)
MTMTQAGSMPPIHAVLFDMDGTLLNSRAAIAETYRRATGAVLRKPFAAAGPPLDHVLQLRASEAFLFLADQDAALADELAATFQRIYAELEPDIALFDGAAEVLAELRRRDIRLGVVTTKARRRLDMHLETAGLTDVLDVTVAGEETERNKPDPLPITVALERLGVPPQRALYVGDGPNDVIAARRAGARPVGVAHGFHPAECRAAEPEFWIDALPALLDLVGESMTTRRA